MADEERYPVTVDGIGDFIFRFRTMGLGFQIENETVEEIGKWPAHAGAHSMCRRWKELQFLTVKAPPDWDLEDLDFLDEADTQKLMKVSGAFRSAEDTFRAERKQKRALARAGAV